MADEPKKEHPEEIESILSDLDAILSDSGGDALIAPVAAEPPKAAPPAPKPVDIPKPVEAAKPVEAPKPVEPPKPVAAPRPVEAVKSVEIPMPVELPKPVEAPKPPSIELAPRDGMIKPPEKKPEPPKPAPKLPAQSGIELSAGPSIPMPPAPVAAPTAPKPPPPVVEAPKAPPAVVEAPKPPPVVAPIPAPKAPPAVIDSPKANQPLPGKPDDFPADAPKEQIRRVAYIYTASCAEVKTAFGVFLSQAAKTISKRPLFIREVLSHEVGAAADPNAVLQKALQMKAAAILAVVEEIGRASCRERV